MKETWVAVAVWTVAALALVSTLVFRLLRTVRGLRNKLAPILSVEEEAQRLSKESAERLEHAQVKIAELGRKRDALAAEYAQGRYGLHHLGPASAWNPIPTDATMPRAACTFTNGVTHLKEPT